MRNVPLNWKSQKSWIEKLPEVCKEIAMKIAENRKPTSFKDVGDLYHGKGKYWFFPDFSEWVNGGVDSIKERITALSSPEANISFHEHILELTPDAFMPFMESLFNSDFTVNVSNLYNPGNIDWQPSLPGDGGQFDPTEVIDKIQEGIEDAADFLISLLISLLGG